MRAGRRPSESFIPVPAAAGAPAGAGNLFTVSCERYIEVRDEGGELVVEVRGVDVYDPTTGDIRSGGVDQVALWVVDTDHDDESFFVRHC